MASALKLKNDIQKLKKAIDNKATNPKFIPKLKEQLEKLEDDLAKLKKTGKPGKRPYTRAEGSALNQLKNKLKGIEKQYKGYSGKSALSLERDANRPAKPIGKRKSKSGNTYYEYRANRIDVKQPPKVFPKLEDGGYMANEGKYLRTLPTQDDLYAFMILDKKSGFGAPLDYKVYGKVQAKKIKEKYEDKIEKDRELKMFSVKELLDRKSFGAQNKQMIEEEFKRSVAQIKQMMQSLNINDYKELYLEDGGYMAKGGTIKEGDMYYKPSPVTIGMYDKGRDEWAVRDACGGLERYRTGILKQIIEEGDWEKDEYQGHKVKGGDKIGVIKEGDIYYKPSLVTIGMYDKGRDEWSVRDACGGLERYRTGILKQIIEGGDWEKYEQGGYMKGGGVIRKLLDFQRKYDENEAINYHSENVVLLAETFGTKEDVKEAKAILKQHEDEGHLTKQNAERRDKLSEKLEAIWEKEINSYKEGGYMAGGGETPVENSTMKGKTITIKLPNETESFKDRVVEEYSDHVWGKKGVWSKKYIVGKAEEGGYMAGGGETDDFVKINILKYYDRKKGKWIEINHIVNIPSSIYYDEFAFPSAITSELERNGYKVLGQEWKFEVMADGGMMAKGGVAEHGIMKGDHVVDIYEDTLVIENGGKKYFVFIKTGEREEVAEKGGYMTHGGETHRSEKNKK